MAPHLPLARGPKVSAPSAAHEIFLHEFGGLPARRRAYSRHNRAKEHASAATEATRREFNVSHFDQRSVRRRLARRKVKKIGDPLWATLGRVALPDPKNNSN